MPAQSRDDNNGDFILSELRYIRGKVDDISQRLDNHNTRITKLESSQEAREQTKHDNEKRSQTISASRLYIITAVAVILSSASFVMRAMGL